MHFAMIWPWLKNRLYRPTSTTKPTAPTTPNAAISLSRIRHEARSRSRSVGVVVFSMMSAESTWALRDTRAAWPLSSRRGGRRLPSCDVDARTELPVVGMVGAGQLARMTHQAAIALGQSLRILAESADDGAALVAADVVVGDYRSLDALRAFARGCDVVTFDHEHVPNEHVAALADAGVSVYPGAAALRYAQDKALMRARLTDLGVPSPRWLDLSAADDPGAALAEFGAEVGWPVVLKVERGGYDGRGVWLVGSLDEAALHLDSGAPLLAEAKVPIARELAAVVARSPFGQGAAWPVVQTVQDDGVCVEVIAPAPDLPGALADEAQQLALRIAAELRVTGVLAVELFETVDGRLVVNELAMRPHNSGHWTIEGARTSQFEQHLRAVLDYPMGDTGLTAPAVAMANVLGGELGGMSIDERLHHLFATDPGVKVHFYGKQVRPGRKIAHVTALGDDMAAVRDRARRAAHLPGMVASATTLPVIGVPVPLKYLDGLDSLLSIVQMPAGVPVATVSIGGARNAGLLAVRILGASDSGLRARLAAYQQELKDLVAEKDRALTQAAERSA